MYIDRHEKSVIGGGWSSESSVERGSGGARLLRRRAIGGGIALSREGKENNLKIRRKELKGAIIPL